MTLSWTPVRRGPVYCSPACGYDCKQVDYDRCVLAANELAASLGQGWTPRVWENLGWYYEARLVCNVGHTRVSPPQGPTPADKWWASFELKGGGQWIGCGDSADQAVSAACLEAYGDALRIVKLLRAMGISPSPEEMKP